VLDRLEKRGGVTRRKQGRSFVYVPKLSREELRRFAVKELVDRFFEGSPESLTRFLRSQESGVRNQHEDLDASLL